MFGTVGVVFLYHEIYQLTAQISENLGEDERLVQGLCALLLGICIYYNDNSLENYTKYVEQLHFCHCLLNRSHFFM